MAARDSNTIQAANDAADELEDQVYDSNVDPDTINEIGRIIAQQSSGFSDPLMPPLNIGNANVNDESPASKERDKDNGARRSLNADAAFAVYSAGITRYNNFSITIGGKEIDAGEFENEVTEILENWEEHKEPLEAQGYSDEEIQDIRDELERARDMLADGHLTEYERDFIDSIDTKVLDIILPETKTESADNNTGVKNELVKNNSNSISESKPDDNSVISKKENPDEPKDLLADGHLTQKEQDFAESFSPELRDIIEPQPSTNRVDNSAGAKNNSFANDTELTSGKSSPDNPEYSGFNDLVAGHPFTTAPPCSHDFKCAVNNEERKPQNDASREATSDKTAENTSSTGPKAVSPEAFGGLA